jgi:hypothetical protein
MQFDRGYISPYFITNADKMRTEWEDPYLWLPKILSDWIRVVTENQRIIAFDACAPTVARRVYRRSIQVATAT